MTGKTRTLFVEAPLMAAICLAACVVLGAGSARAAIQYESDGAAQDASNGGWDLPTQGTCVPGNISPAPTTRPECQAIRLPNVCSGGTSANKACAVAGDCPGGSCVAATSTSCAVNYTWGTSQVCDDPAHDGDQAGCTALPGRMYTNGKCAVTMLGMDRNIAECVGLGGVWVTSGECTGKWNPPSPSSATGSTITTTSSPGDQCLRCHNITTQYNAVAGRWVGESYVKQGHKNMARKVTAGKPWGGPPFSCTNPVFTTEDTCEANGGTWVPSIYPTDSSGNVINWATGQVTLSGVPTLLYWIYDAWLEPPQLPSEIYSAAPVGGKPGVSYSCARCHTTGWTSDASLQSSKEPEKSFGGVVTPVVTWDGVTAALTGQVNLASGVSGDTNVRGSWNQYGIMCGRCHGSAGDNSYGSCTITCNGSQSVCESSSSLIPPGCGGTWSGGACTKSSDGSALTTTKVTLDQATCTALPNYGGAWSAGPPYAAPKDSVGNSYMTTHDNNLTLPDNTSGLCTDPRFLTKASCEQVRTLGDGPLPPQGVWLTACSTTTPDVCVYPATTQADCLSVAGNAWTNTGNLCFNTSITTQQACSAASGTWMVDAVNTANSGCAFPTYTTSGDCTANGGTWTGSNGWCTVTGYTQVQCGGVVIHNASVPDSTTCTNANGTWETATSTCRFTASWNRYGTKQSCQVGGGTWTASSCSVLAVCSKPGNATQAACQSAGGVWTAITSEPICVDAGGTYTGNNPQRGQIIIGVCTQCHRQETSGVPYADSGSGKAGADSPTAYAAAHPGQYIKIGPYHNTVTFPSHPHGNMYLNSPHGQFTGTFAQIATGGFKFDGTGLYKSFFINDGESANTGNGCTGCHNVHKSVAEGVGADEPVKECTECHAKNLSLIKHPKGAGTPLENLATDPASACESCHMPGGVHMFRINADQNYSTFPPAALTQVTNANTAPDGSFAPAVWVDLDMACGQCHGGGASNVTTAGSIAGDSGSCTAAGGTWNASTAQCSLTAQQECAGAGGTWDSSTSTCTLVGAAPPACTAAGGTWMIATSTCTIDLAAMCTASGGTWASSTCTLSPSAACTAVGGTWNAPPTSTCTLNSLTTQATCVAGGGTWAAGPPSTCTLDMKKVLQVSSSVVIDPMGAPGFAAGQRITIAGGASSAGLPADFPTYIVSVSGSTLILAGPTTMSVAGVSVVQNATNNGGYMTKTELATYAKGIHNDAPSVDFSYTLNSSNTLIVNVFAMATCNGTCNVFDWDWGDGTAHGSGMNATHTYASAGPKAITLTVEQFGVGSGTKTKIVNVFTADLGPTVGGTACSAILQPDWSASLTDNSTDDNAVSMVTVTWGDGSLLAIGGQGSTFTHTYRGPGSYLITQKALDAAGQQSVRTCPIIVRYFTISGTVVQSDGSTIVPGATITVQDATTGIVVKTAYSAAGTGMFNAGSLRPGSYTLTATKWGFVFPDPWASYPPLPTGITVGPNSTGNTITAISP